MCVVVVWHPIRPLTPCWRWFTRLPTGGREPCQGAPDEPAEGGAVPGGRFISYLRVSTKRQGQSGLGLDAQREAVNGYLNGGSWSLIHEVVEVESGKRDSRPKLAEALDLCRIHGTTLIIAKLDRLARNVAFLLRIIDSGVDAVCRNCRPARSGGSCSSRWPRSPNWKPA